MWPEDKSHAWPEDISHVAGRQVKWPEDNVIWPEDNVMWPEHKSHVAGRHRQVIRRQEHVSGSDLAQGASPNIPPQG
jgi:hypothetical protein